MNQLGAHTAAMSNFYGVNQTRTTGAREEDHIGAQAAFRYTSMIVGLLSLFTIIALNVTNIIYMTESGGTMESIKNAQQSLSGSMKETTGILIEDLKPKTDLINSQVSFGIPSQLSLIYTTLKNEVLRQCTPSFLFNNTICPLAEHPTHSSYFEEVSLAGISSCASPEGYVDVNSSFTYVEFPSFIPGSTKPGSCVKLPSFSLSDTIFSYSHTIMGHGCSEIDVGDHYFSIGRIADHGTEQPVFETITEWFINDKLNRRSCTVASGTYGAWMGCVIMTEPFLDDLDSTETGKISISYMDVYGRKREWLYSKSEVQSDHSYSSWYFSVGSGVVIEDNVYFLVWGTLTFSLSENAFCRATGCAKFTQAECNNAQRPSAFGNHQMVNGILSFKINIDGKPTLSLRTISPGLIPLGSEGRLMYFKNVNTTYIYIRSTGWYALPLTGVITFGQNPTIRWTWQTSVSRPGSVPCNSASRCPYPCVTGVYTDLFPLKENFELSITANLDSDVTRVNPTLILLNTTDQIYRQTLTSTAQKADYTTTTCFMFKLRLWCLSIVELSPSTITNSEPIPFLYHVDIGCRSPGSNVFLPIALGARSMQVGPFVLPRKECYFEQIGAEYYFIVSIPGSIQAYAIKDLNPDRIPHVGVYINDICPLILHTYSSLTATARMMTTMTIGNWQFRPVNRPGGVRVPLPKKPTNVTLGRFYSPEDPGNNYYNGASDITVDVSTNDTIVIIENCFRITRKTGEDVISDMQCNVVRVVRDQGPFTPSNIKKIATMYPGVGIDRTPTDASKSNTTVKSAPKTTAVSATSPTPATHAAVKTNKPTMSAATTARINHTDPAIVTIRSNPNQTTDHSSNSKVTTSTTHRTPTTDPTTASSTSPDNQSQGQSGVTQKPAPSQEHKKTPSKAAPTNSTDSNRATATETTSRIAYWPKKTTTATPINTTTLAKPSNTQPINKTTTFLETTAQKYPGNSTDNIQNTNTLGGNQNTSNTNGHPSENTTASNVTLQEEEQSKNTTPQNSTQKQHQAEPTPAQGRNETERTQGTTNTTTAKDMINAAQAKPTENTERDTEQGQSTHIHQQATIESKKTPTVQTPLAKQTQGKVTNQTNIDNPLQDTTEGTKQSHTTNQTKAPGDDDTTLKDEGAENQRSNPDNGTGDTTTHEVTNDKSTSAFSQTAESNQSPSPQDSHPETNEAAGTSDTEHANRNKTTNNATDNLPTNQKPTAKSTQEEQSPTGSTIEKGTTKESTPTSANKTTTKTIPNLNTDQLENNNTNNRMITDQGHANQENTNTDNKREVTNNSNTDTDDIDQPVTPSPPEDKQQTEVNNNTSVPTDDGTANQADRQSPNESNSARPQQPTQDSTSMTEEETMQQLNQTEDSQDLRPTTHEGTTDPDPTHTNDTKPEYDTTDSGADRVVETRMGASTLILSNEWPIHVYPNTAKLPPKPNCITPHNICTNKTYPINQFDLPCQGREGENLCIAKASVLSYMEEECPSGYLNQSMPSMLGNLESDYGDCDSGEMLRTGYNYICHQNSTMRLGSREFICSSPDILVRTSLTEPNIYNYTAPFVQSLPHYRGRYPFSYEELLTWAGQYMPKPDKQYCGIGELCGYTFINYYDPDVLILFEPHFYYQKPKHKGHTTVSASVLCNKIFDLLLGLKTPHHHFIIVPYRDKVLTLQSVAYNDFADLKGQKTRCSTSANKRLHLYANPRFSSLPSRIKDKQDNPAEPGLEGLKIEGTGSYRSSTIETTTRRKRSTFGTFTVDGTGDSFSDLILSALESIWYK